MKIAEGFKDALALVPFDPVGAPFLLAVSGGVDSVVLFHLFKQAGVPFAVAHANFQLRGSDSDADELWVNHLAASAGIACFTKQFQTKETASGQGISIQMAARSLRYEWFESLMAEYGFGALVTAHHLDDAVETVLLNFIKGTGLAGLKGLPVWVAAQRRFRPLMFASKSDIMQYAQEQGMAWCEDRSNAEVVYQRNYIRHRIIPAMTEMNPNFIRTAERTLERLQAAHENLDFLTRQWLKWPDPVPNTAFTVEKASLLALPSPERALSPLLKSLGFDTEQVRQIAAHVPETGFECRASSGVAVYCDRHVLRIFPAGNSPATKSEALLQVQPDDLMLRLPDGAALFFVPTPAVEQISGDPNSITVPIERLLFPLSVRHWQPGDIFQPFGMQGHHQKLQDFFTNQKLTRLEKDATWLLINGDGAIIWVVGQRLDHRFRVMSDEPALKINWIPPQS